LDKTEQLCNSVQQKYLSRKYVSIYYEKVDHIKVINNILFPATMRHLQMMISLGRIVPHFNYRLTTEEVSSSYMSNGHWMQILINGWEQEEVTDILWH